MEASSHELIVAPSDIPPEPETALCVRRARAGDEQAFAFLVERHERMVLRTALRLLGRLDLAQDAAQEAFLRLHRYLGRFDESKELGPWLYRVVVNVCRDMSRRLPRFVDLDEVHAVESPDPGLDDAVARDEQRRLIQRALLTLPLKERAAIVLRDIEGLASREVARILGVSEATVRSQISTGRLRIKRYVEAHGGIRR